MSKDLLDTKSAKNHKTLYLVDGNSLIYRAFYALPDTMQTPSGIKTNAIYGFTNILLKLIEDKPDFIAIAFDRPTPTFRHEKFSDYKATRQKQPESLTEQIERIKELIVSFDIKYFECDGYEADDIIATIAKKAEKDGINVKIFTGDKDVLQLVSDKINVVSFVKGISETFEYNKKTVLDKIGVKPEQIVDYKALVGDASDNIPGVKGIGSKSAIDLLSKYGTVEKILEKVDEIGGSIGQKIKLGKQEALLSKELSKLYLDVPINFNLHELEFSLPAWEKILPVFEKYDFKSLLKKYGGIDAVGLFTKDIRKKVQDSIKNLQYILVSDIDTAKKVISGLKNSKSFSFDTETTSLDELEASLIGISFCNYPNVAYYFPYDFIKANNLFDELKLLFLDDNILKVGHNLKYDLKVLSKYGLISFGPFFDTMIASYLLEPTIGKHTLKYLGEKYLGRKMTTFDELLLGDSSSDIRETNIENLKNYACADADITFQLKEILEKEIIKNDLSKVFFDIEIPLIKVLAEMELFGVTLDCDKIFKLGEEVSNKLKLLEKEIYIISGEKFNLNSPKQLSYILYEKLKLPILKKTKTGCSTDSDVLEVLASDFEIAQKLLEYRQLAKLKSTYIDVLPTLVNKKTGKIHTSFNQILTATGRLSSSNPNLQNIPIKTEIGQKIREAFIPFDTKDREILSADYSQIELRILAHLSDDAVMIKEFIDGNDIHLSTAAEIFGVNKDAVTKQMRSFAKTINFGIIYGMSAFGLSKTLNIKKSDAEEYIKKYFEKYKKVKEFISDTINFAKKNGYVRTLFGRKRYLHNINSRNFSLQQADERIAINTPVQGTAADIIKMAMVKIHQRLKEFNPQPYMIMQIHDELVFDVHKENIAQVKNVIEDCMTNIVTLKVPLVINMSSGENWGILK